MEPTVNAVYGRAKGGSYLFRRQVFVDGSWGRQGHVRRMDDFAFARAQPRRTVDNDVIQMGASVRRPGPGCVSRWITGAVAILRPRAAAQPRGSSLGNSFGFPIVTNPREVGGPVQRASLPAPAHSSDYFQTIMPRRNYQMCSPSQMNTVCLCSSRTLERPPGTRWPSLFARDVYAVARLRPGRDYFCLGAGSPGVVTLTPCLRIAAIASSSSCSLRAFVHFA